MRAKTILALLFLASLGVGATVLLRALPQLVAAAPGPVAQDEILVATMPLAAGTLLRAHDVTWQTIARPPEPGEIVRPSAAVRQAKPEADEEARAEVYGAALRGAVSPGDPIRRGPVATGGASTGFLFPGDRVDVILTQKFTDAKAPLTRRSVSETVVENLRVLVIDAVDAKMATGNTFGRTVTLEVTPDQAEKINVATELGKLSLTLRSVSGADGVAAAAAPGPGKATGIKPTWAGDVSPALGDAMPERVIPAERPSVEVIRGNRGAESVKQQ